MSSHSLANDSAPNLLGFSRAQLEEYFIACGDKKFRAQQWMQWVHQRGVLDYDAMTNLSKTLRATLQTQTTLELPKVVVEDFSTDGTIKWLLQVDGGNAIETVYIPEKTRGTLCISSQVGCALDCTFCATARQGFNRNLTAAEIIGQVWIGNQRLRELKKGETPITNVVFMGMGEPLLNFDKVISAVHLLLDDFAYGLGKRKVTVSTSGVVPKIDALSEAVDVSLAISLHAPTDEVRNELVPLNRKYPIETLMAACKRYLANKQRKECVTFEYVMLKDVNDSIEQAHQLVKLIGDMRAKINLIPFNSFAQSGYERSTQKAIDEFSQVLIKSDLIVITRRPRGEDIAAACGQLAGQIKDKSHRGSHYQRLYERSKLSKRIEPTCV